MQLWNYKKCISQQSTDDLRAAPCGEFNRGCHEPCFAGRSITHNLQVCTVCMFGNKDQNAGDATQGKSSFSGSYAGRAADSLPGLHDRLSAQNAGFVSLTEHLNTRTSAASFIFSFSVRSHSLNPIFSASALATGQRRLELEAVSADARAA